MARIRSVHPGLFTDEAFVSCSQAARLLYIGLWTEADDGGAFEWKPVTLKMRIMPVDNVDIPALLGELAETNMVKRYSAGGREYGAIRNFCRFQRPKKPKRIHPMPDEYRTYSGSGSESSEPNEAEDDGGGEPRPLQPKPVPPNAGFAPQMEDGGGRMKEEAASSELRNSAAAAAAAAVADADFEGRCRRAVHGEPCSSRSMDPLLDWRAKGCPEAVILAGIAAGIRKATHSKFESFASFDGWIKSEWERGARSGGKPLPRTLSPPSPELAAAHRAKLDELRAKGVLA